MASSIHIKNTYTETDIILLQAHLIDVLAQLSSRSTQHYLGLINACYAALSNGISSSETCLGVTTSVSKLASVIAYNSLPGALPTPESYFYYTLMQHLASLEKLLSSYNTPAQGRFLKRATLDKVVNNPGVKYV